MKKKIEDVKLVIFLTIIFCTMFAMLYFTINMNNTAILIKTNQIIKGVQENTVNTKTTGNNTNTSNSGSSKATTTQSSNTQKATNTSSNGSTTATKSSNADLSNLGIKPNDFSGFTSNKTTYDVTVPADVTEVEVYATAQNSEAKISGTGKQKLQDGKNELTVTVTAASGATKKYTINVTKEASTQSNTEDSTAAKGLSSLKVGNLELSPKFETNVYEYTAKYEGDDNKIDIKAVATDPKYVVDITGNSDLKDGENIITILVSDSEETNVATYQVTVSKNVVDENKLQKEQEDAKKQEEQRKLVMMGAIVAVVILAIIIYLVIRHKRNNAWAEDYMMPYSSDRSDDGFVEDYNSQENNNNDNINNEASDKKQEDDSIKEDFQMSKKEAREMFLSGYDHKEENYESNYEKPRVKRHHSKGKRFK